MKPLILIIALVVLAGCAAKEESTNQPTYTEPERYTNWHYDLFVDSVRGHEYIIYDGYKSGGIIHAEHCQCKGGR